MMWTSWHLRALCHALYNNDAGSFKHNMAVVGCVYSTLERALLYTKWHSQVLHNVGYAMGMHNAMCSVDSASHVAASARVVMRTMWRRHVNLLFIW